MNQTMTVNCRFHVANNGRRRELREGDAKPRRNDVPKPVPRISRLMALAIRFDQLIRDGVVADQAELARLGHVTRARMTQIMNLLNLAPDIQEDILFLPPKEKGRDRITERDVRPIVNLPDWRKQRRSWARFARA
jgi:hypothetical protein